MAALKCPNPSCPFLFDPTQVPPGAVLTCPRCGMRFTLGPTTFQPPAPPIADAIPDAQPVFDEPAAPVAAAEPVQPPAAPPQPGGALLKIVLGTLVLVVAVGLIVGVRALGFFVRKAVTDETPSGDTVSTDRPKPKGPEQVYTSQLGKYRLSNYEKIWEPMPAEPKDDDPNGDLLLRGTHRPPGQSRLNRLSTAKLVVIVLEKSGDVDEANRYVRNRHENEGVKDVAPTDFTEVSDEPLGEAPPGEVKANAPTKRLKVRPGGAIADSSSEKLVVYAAIKVGEDVIVAEASCAWADREIWERRLLQLVGSLRP